MLEVAQVRARCEIWGGVRVLQAELSGDAAHAGDVGDVDPELVLDGGVLIGVHRVGELGVSLSGFVVLALALEHDRTSACRSA